MSSNQQRHTKMGLALMEAFIECRNSGRNSGRVGHRILTQTTARGDNSLVIVKKKSTAETADKK